jgi:hypothetical protein
LRRAGSKNKRGSARASVSRRSASARSSPDAMAWDSAHQPFNRSDAEVSVTAGQRGIG